MKRQSAQQSVPLDILDEHNEAFYFWHKARHDGRLTRPLDIIHLDAHPDMATPERVSKSVHFSGRSRERYLDYYATLAHDDLSIANFITPAVLNGLVRNVYFVPPGWRSARATRRKRNIATVFGEGYVFKHDLQVAHDLDRRVKAAYPDLTHFSYFVRPLQRLPRKRSVILDIDLDYFACVDSITNGMVYELEITCEQFEKRQSFFATNRDIRYGLIEFEFIERGSRHYVRVSHRKGKDVSHLPSQDAIRSEIELLVTTLHQKDIRPKAVTICRSRYSGFCPAEYQAFTEASLVRALKSWLDCGGKHTRVRPVG